MKEKSFIRSVIEADMESFILMVAMVCGSIGALIGISLPQHPDLSPFEQQLNTISKQYSIAQQNVIKTYNNRLLQSQRTNKPVDTNILTNKIDDVSTDDIVNDNNEQPEIFTTNASTYSELCSKLLEKQKNTYQIRLQTINDKVLNKQTINYSQLLKEKPLDNSTILKKSKKKLLEIAYNELFGHSQFFAIITIGLIFFVTGALIGLVITSTI